MQDKNLSELSQEEKVLIAYWKTISARVKEDLANIWTEEVTEEFKGLREECLFILKRIHSKRKKSWSQNKKEIEDIERFLRHIERPQSSNKFIELIHSDLKKIISDIEEERRQFLRYKATNPFGNVYPYILSEEETGFLLHLKSEIQRKSMDIGLRIWASQRNRTILDPMGAGSLIHGIKQFHPTILSSIIDNGILCAEFLGYVEDGETFFHADFIESNKNSVVEWQEFINRANRFKAYMPYNYKYSQAIALIVNRSSRQSWKEAYESRENNIRSKFINYFPIRYTEEGPNQVSILGGVASYDIYGIILNPNVDVNMIVNFFRTKNFYIPLFNALGQKVY